MLTQAKLMSYWPWIQFYQTNMRMVLIKFTARSECCQLWKCQTYPLKGELMFDVPGHPKVADLHHVVLIHQTVPRCLEETQITRNFRQRTRNFRQNCTGTSFPSRLCERNVTGGMYVDLLKYLSPKSTHN